MKRLLLASVVTAFALAIPISSNVSGKAHVPVNKAQVCHKGTVIVISENAVQGHVRGHGDCELPACDFNPDNIFQAGQDCSGLADRGDGRCALDDRIDAGGQTPACPEGKF